MSCFRKPLRMVTHISSWNMAARLATDPKHGAWVPPFALLHSPWRPKHLTERLSRVGHESCRLADGIAFQVLLSQLALIRSHALDALQLQNLSNTALPTRGCLGWVLMQEVASTCHLLPIQASAPGRM